MDNSFDDRGQSIVELSLTELAFIFFFILLVFSVWKISDSNKKIKENESTLQAITNDNKDLKSALKEATKHLQATNFINHEEIFIELSQAKEKAAKAKFLEKENKKLNDELSSLTNLIAEVLSDQNYNFDEIKSTLRRYHEIINILKKTNDFDKNKDSNIANILTKIIDKNNELTGQNVYLRSKLNSLGNGLDHPPCWINKNGKVDYLFNVYINEDYVEFKRGWNSFRNKEAIENSNITNIIGQYSKNQKLWKSTLPIFKESVTNKCRHVVRIYDFAISKKAYKYYLLGVENHFYKSLRKVNNEKPL